MKVHYGEGVANRIGPEPCAGSCEGTCEASVGECIGQPLSRERGMSRGPTLSHEWKATRMGATTRALICPGVVGEPGMCRSFLRGNREVSRLTVRQVPPVRIGKARSRSR